MVELACLSQYYKKNNYTHTKNERHQRNQSFIVLCEKVILVKVALGVCFALKSWKEYLLLFIYLIALGKDVTLPIITKFKTNRSLSYSFVNRIPN